MAYKIPKPIKIHRIKHFILPKHKKIIVIKHKKDLNKLTKEDKQFLSDVAKGGLLSLGVIGTGLGISIATRNPIYAVGLTGGIALISAGILLHLLKQEKKEEKAQNKNGKIQSK